MGRGNFLLTAVTGSGPENAPQGVVDQFTRFSTAPTDEAEAWPAQESRAQVTPQEQEERISWYLGVAATWTPMHLQTYTVHQGATVLRKGFQASIFAILGRENNTAGRNHFSFRGWTICQVCERQAKACTLRIDTVHQGHHGG